MAAKWEQELLGPGRKKWVARQVEECEACKAERKRRCNIIWSNPENEARAKRAPFNTAAYVHHFRYPSHHAQHLRAIAFAKEKRQRLFWTTAFDKPKQDGEARFKGERGEEKKEEWLHLPPGKTSGIPGLLPLVVDLPIIFKECPDADARRKGVFKNARGILRGWDLDEEEQKRLSATDEPEVVLMKRPKKLYIEVLGGSKELPLVDGKRIYALRAVPKEWSLDGKGNVPITRYGFCIVPDFAGTAHFYCGTSLDAALGDLLPWWQAPTKDQALRSYIIRSRVKQNEALLITQPYSPHLFRQGVLPGPDLLQKVLTRRMKPEDAKQAWKQVEQESEEKESGKKTAANKKTTNPDKKIRAPCRQCSRDARARADDINDKTEVWRPLSAFEFISEGHAKDRLWQDTFALGQDLLCAGCRPHTRGRAGKLILCDQCEDLKPDHNFTEEMQAAWDQHLDFPMCCQGCRDAGKTLSEAPMHWCYGAGCGAERREYQFLEETITAVHAGRIDNVEQLCVRCKLIEGKCNKTYDAAKRYECSKCHAKKALTEFSPADLKEWLRDGGGGKNYFRWVCYDCRFPLCKLCVELGDMRRPRDAVKHNALIDNVYYCLEHKYPRCSGVDCAKKDYVDRAERVITTKKPGPARRARRQNPQPWMVRLVPSLTP